MLEKISGEISNLLEKEPLAELVKKIWVYQHKTVVVDLVYRQVNFTFDITPSTGSCVDLDVVQRKPHDGRYLTPSGARKERLASNVELATVPPMLHEAAAGFRRRIDGQLARRRIGTEDQAALGTVHPRRALRVGVMTLPLNRNFGGNLQAFALMQLLRKLGHQPFLLNRQHPPKDGETPPAQHGDGSGHPLVDTYGMNPAIPNAEFIDRYLTPATPRAYSSRQLGDFIDAVQPDAIVVGSDQVWRAKYARTILTDFFLGFLPETSRTLRISYAASFGADKIAYGDQREEAARLVQLFDAVSVREDSAVELCSTQLGASAQHVLDPTLLLDPSDYTQIFPAEPAASTGQLLSYVLDADADKEKVITEVARRLGISPYGTNGLPFRAEGALKAGEGNRSVEHWVASFHQPAFVITDSFHGVVFSLLFNRPFIAYGNPKRGMARFESLLRMVGLEDRLVVNAAGADLSALLAPIDWARVNARLADLRDRSIGFLDFALQQERRLPPAIDRRAKRRIPRPVPDPLGNNPLRVLCTGCGACVSEAAGTLAMGWNDEGFLMPKAVGGPVPQQARRVCPFNPTPDTEVQDEDALAELFLGSAKEYDPAAGRFEAAYVGYSIRYRESSSSGGLATYVFEQLIKRRIVDYLFVVQSDGSDGYRYRVCKNVEDFRTISKTRYYPVSMHELFDLIDQTEGRVAVSGVACFVKAIRLKQHYHPQYREKIPFVVGIICGGLKSRHYTDFLARSAKIEGPYRNPEYRVKDPASTASDYSFAAIGLDGGTRQIKMRRVGNNWGAGLFKARACDFCSDVLTELADISLGDAWLPQYRDDGMGHNVVLTRTSLAEDIIRSGITNGEVHADIVPVGLVVDSQAGGFNHKRKGLKFRVWAAINFHRFQPPKLRERLLTPISISDGVVQMHRERTRSKSLTYWGEASSVEDFRRRMRSSRLALKAATAARKDGTNAPFISALSGADEALATAPSGNRSRHSLLRLFQRKVRGDRFLIGMLRAALFSGGPVKRDDLNR